MRPTAHKLTYSTLLFTALLLLLYLNLLLLEYCIGLISDLAFTQCSQYGNTVCSLYYYALFIQISVYHVMVMHGAKISILYKHTVLLTINQILY